MARVDARILKTQRTIIQTATTLIALQPDFSVTELLEKAAITRGTFYKYYPNKEALVYEINQQQIEKFMALIRDGVISVDFTLRLIASQATFYDAAINQRVNDAFFQSLMTQWRAVVDARILQDFPDATQMILYQWEILQAGFWAQIRQWLQGGMQVPQSEILDNFTTVWGNSITSALKYFDLTLEKS
jgi:AcrR family transcriptional regulator